LAPPVVTVTVLFIFTIQAVVVTEAETVSLQCSGTESRHKQMTWMTEFKKGRKYIGNKEGRMLEIKTNKV
jgi:hypothetical protein